jgi:hypothetical protein
MKIKYFSYKIKMFILAFVIISVINSAFSQLNMNFIKKLSDYIKSKSNMDINIERGFYLVAGIFAIMIALKRDTWLPFLGENVLPSSLIPFKDNIGDTLIKVHVKPNTKVAYWAALPKDKKLKEDPYVTKAYGDYTNSGVIKSDDKGIAILTIKKSSGYYIPSGKHLQSHVHYREIYDEWGMIGPIKTQYF